MLKFINFSLKVLLKSYGIIKLCSSGTEALILNIHSRLKSISYLLFFYLNQLASIRVTKIGVKISQCATAHIFSDNKSNYK